MNKEISAVERVTELVKAARRVSDILHELEAKGVELTPSQDKRWAVLTDKILEVEKKVL